MVRVLKRVLFLGVLLAVLTVAAGWLFFALPFLAPQRAAIAEGLLSKSLDRPVTVSGDADLRFGETVRLIVTDIRIPSATTNDVFASLDVLELDVKLRDLLNGIVALDDVKAQGMVASFITFEDGTKSWSRGPDEEGAGTGEDEQDSKPPPDESGQPAKAKPGSSDRSAIDLRDVTLKIENQISGFVFNVRLEDILYRQSDEGDGAELVGNGTVNGQPLKIEGRFPRRAPFTTLATIGNASLVLEGNRNTTADGGGFTAQLNSDIEDVGNMLELLELERAMEGRGSLNAEIRIQGTQLSVEHFEAVLDTKKDTQLTATGAIEHLAKLDGINVEIDGRLYPEGDPPPRAATLRDIELMGFGMTLKGSNEDLVLDSLFLSTNAFDQGFGRIGQAAIRRFHRTPEGKLEIRDIELQAGPQDAPYFSAKGTIGDALRLRELDLAGDLSLPASRILRSPDPGDARVFGGIKGEFSVVRDEKASSTVRFKGESVDTDLWSLAADSTLTGGWKSHQVDIKIAAGVEDTAEFLAAMGLKPVEGEALRFALGITGSESAYSNEIGLTAGTTQAELDLNVRLEDTGPVARGTLVSERIAIPDIRQAAAFFLEFRKRRKLPKAEREAQPLVLADDPEVQPLLLADEREVQPLVLEKGDAPEAIEDLAHLDTLVSRADVDIEIDIQQIAGKAGISEVQSELILRDGKLSFGPLNINYGGGYFHVDASMDAVASPGVISVAGATSGWDFGKIVRSVGADIGASGVLTGRFALTGSHSSAPSFLRTMVGNVEVSMGQGRLDTSLLELAGLGVLPWLFSREMREGSTRIVCIEAPLRIDRGRITSNRMVAETPDVQLVARGTVDVPGDFVSIRAEPRPVGRPLARSAVPFDVFGKLSDPQVEVHLGGARARRADGADTMPIAREPCTPDIYQLQ